MEPQLSRDLGPVLTALARTAVATSFEPRPPDAAALAAAGAAPALGRREATFVTLERDGALRGCIGTLRALRPLGVDVVRNARAAARDPRMPAVRPEEVDELRITVTVLSPPEPMGAGDFTALLERLRPGVDGLTLKDGGRRRATFLPSVWAGLPEPERFVAALLRKGGWPQGPGGGGLRSAAWPEGLEAERYETVSFTG
ncbi:AmmeMemoRadiSam system protein A [Glycomyces sp. A-F 0318]|uniref:AmmeMemoRadiSam system protein A n=1 Tax=Glycomyces amatae TaxID=2881355 RepID=UPI001E49F2C7|nr:AmmeMemoRadiSam system protein A [Glycomyces amatae]MCD0447123.1 AmmeMemoRadiSam system protein A [Glycomyces amatae]